ncbi:MAG: 4-hydroxythreonine-4-phosphate dehydrogenase PdxA [Planctomycetia bacterium]|nr:4-hydroxythreonine-4-phosphate dehydrogenase PdxA [Planctomycetia bacterium]
MLPRIALTMGDVAGIGPEVIVRAWRDGSLADWCRPVVVGDADVLRRAIQLVGADLAVQPVDDVAAGAAAPDTIPCWNPSHINVAQVLPGVNDSRAGAAAYDWLAAAAQAALAGQVDAVVTAPLSKAALHLAGREYPGHTEILAEFCGVRDFAMMLYLPGLATESGKSHSLGVVHATLHTSIRSVPQLLSESLIIGKIRLIAGFLESLGTSRPRIAVCALNPHAGEEGLFGDEEQTTIAPAVAAAARDGLNVVGPLPADTVFLRAVSGEFDGVVAMYHDQGHIALKLVGRRRAVNVTLGLPIVRTSPSHGTAFDIAWQGRAHPEGLIEALRVAVKLCRP